jgi:hypothetical protein
VRATAAPRSRTNATSGCGFAHHRASEVILSELCGANMEAGPGFHAYDPAVDDVRYAAP